jgi:hypothetical protein
VTALALTAVIAIGQAATTPRLGSDVARQLRSAERAILAHEAADLRSAVKRLEAEGKAAVAESVRALIEPEPAASGPLRFRPLAELVPPRAEPAPDALPPAVQAIRSAAARALFDLASRAVTPSAQRFGLASTCLRAVLDRDSDHAEARRLLGYVRHGGGWATPYAVENLKNRRVLDATFGWVGADWVPHLQKGELPDVSKSGRPVRWITADEANARRAEDWANAWEIRTEHFKIKTNVPLADAISFGRRLEDLHDLIFCLFADVIGPAHLPLPRLYERKPPAPIKIHEVWYFATKQQYVDFFQTNFNQDESPSLGYYMPPADARAAGITSRSYFYRDDQVPISPTATLFHEGSHQVLFESAGAARYDRNRGNYWVWEGLGTYFETMTPLDDGSYEIGGQVGPRVAKARQDIREGRSIPAAKLFALDKADFDRKPEVYVHYAQAMAWTIFLMHSHGGRYRDEFIDYVADAYRGRLGGRSLPARLGMDVKRLDEEFTTCFQPPRQEPDP